MAEWRLANAGGPSPRVGRARPARRSNPSASSALWAKIDRDDADEAPWMTLYVFLQPDFLSRRTGHYTHCSLSTVTGTTSACLDQLWVR
jgi:hypothetical protein